MAGPPADNIPAPSTARPRRIPLILCFIGYEGTGVRVGGQWLIGGAVRAGGEQQGPSHALHPWEGPSTYWLFWRPRKRGMSSGSRRLRAGAAGSSSTWALAG